MATIPYASTMGSIVYVMLCTKPNIAYVVSVTSRYQSNLGDEHWKVAKGILKYLRRTYDLFIVHEGG